MGGHVFYSSMKVKQKERDFLYHLISIDEEYLMLKLCEASLYLELICCFDLKLIFFWSQQRKNTILCTIVLYNEHTSRPLLLKISTMLINFISQIKWQIYCEYFLYGPVLVACPLSRCLKCTHDLSPSSQGMFVVVQPPCVLSGTTKTMNKAIDQGSWPRVSRGPQWGQQCCAQWDTGLLFLERFGGEVVCRTPSKPDRRTDLSNRKSPLIHTKGYLAMPSTWHHPISRTGNSPWWRRWNERLTAFSLYRRLGFVYRHWQSDGVVERGGVATAQGECIKVGPNSRSGSCGGLQAFFLSLWLSCRREAPEDMKLCGSHGTERGGHLVFVAEKLGVGGQSFSVSSGCGYSGPTSKKQKHIKSTRRRWKSAPIQWSAWLATSLLSF